MSEAVSSSGQIAVTAATAVSVRPSYLYAVMLKPAAAASTITVYDNSSAASGTILAELVAPASGSSVVLNLDSPVYSRNGLTVAVTGASATAVVHFSLAS